jgi:hypothetical protein
MRQEPLALQILYYYQSLLVLVNQNRLRLALGLLEEG